MIHPVYLNREFARWLPLLPADELKTFLALALKANPGGFTRVDIPEVAARTGLSHEASLRSLESLHHRRLIHVSQSGAYLLVNIRAFLGGRGAPHDAVVPSPVDTGRG